MRVFNQEKTTELKEYDLTLGHLVECTLITHIEAVKPIEEVGHWKVLATYENGGQDVEWVVDVEGVKGVEEHDEEESIYIYIPYTESELLKIRNTNRIAELKALLSQTDFKAIKYAEGCYTEKEYQPIKALRQAYRDEINELENELEA